MTNAPLTLDSSLAAVLGERAAASFEKSFGLASIDDLLWYFPRRYAKRGELTALDELPVGEHVSIVAEVRKVTERRMRSRGGSLLEATITDGRGYVTLTFFNQAWRSRELVPGVRGIFSGKVSRYKGLAQLAHPDYELFDELELSAGDERAKRWADELIPIYPASKRLQSWQVQEAVTAVLESFPHIPDPVPHPIRHAERQLNLDEAMRRIHQPVRYSDVVAAKASLAATEAFVFQAALLEQRQVLRQHASFPRCHRDGGFLDRFDASLPFALTRDQQQVGETIAEELSREEPMQRLVQGEVGSGKTLVAIRAMLQTAEDGGQSALLAPTEVLAAQHYRSLLESLGPELGQALMPTLLTGSLPQSERRRAMLRIASGDAKLVIGTHALLSDKVKFADLGLVIVDEQHRFGVEQREALRRRAGRPPHLLVLTATPIPRTVAMTVFGDLDVSTIAELPGGRQGIESFVVAAAERPHWLERAWDRVVEEIANGRQAFVVCSAISRDDAETAPAPDETGAAGKSAESEELPPPATVEDTVEALRAMPRFAGKRIEAVHGKLPAEVKDERMREFAAGSIDVIVATTVIEVGVNVPNASVMIVLDADRFGVSQLHQLRGRVGRGSHPGLCLLVTNALPETPARERVEAVASTLDGFVLAEEDLRLRREGNVLGAAQSGGKSSLRVLRVVDDAELILAARGHAASVLADDPTLHAHPELRAAIDRVSSLERAFLGAS